MQFSEYFQRISFQIEEKPSIVEGEGEEFLWSKQFTKPPYSLSYKNCPRLENPKFKENFSNTDNSVPLNYLDRINQYNRSGNNDEYDDSNQPLKIEKLQSELECYHTDPPWYRYRNNLTVIINNWLVVALGSTIYIYDLHMTYSSSHKDKLLPFVSEINIINETATEQALVEAIMPNVPNTINYITYDEVENVLLIADDFSRVVVIDVLKLESAFKNIQFPPAHENDVRINILTDEKEFNVSVGYYINTKSSPWGLKLYNKILYVSDNSHTVTSFKFTKEGAQELKSSPDLLNNIPSIDVTSSDGSVIIACTTIGGFIYILDAHLNVVDCIKTTDWFGWLCRFIPQTTFLPVHKPQDLTGNSKLSDYLIKDVIAQSQSLNESFEGLGIAANLQHLSVSSSSSTNTDSTTLASNTTIQLNRHLQLIFNKHYHQQKQKNYLFVATRVKTGLFDLILNNLASTNNLFSVNFDVSRINLCCDLFQLNAIVIADPTGFAAVVRFTDYHGIKAYRIEHILLERTTQQASLLVGLSSVISGYDFDGNTEYKVIATFSDKKVQIFHITCNTPIRNNLDIYTVI